VDQTIRFADSGMCVITLIADRKLGEELCRQAAKEKISVGLFVTRRLRKIFLEST